MKNVGLGVKKFIVDTLTPLTVDTKAVPVYSNAPQKPSEQYIWLDVTNIGDLGTKFDFVSVVDIDVVIVNKVNSTANNGTLLENIANSIMVSLIVRNLNTTTSDNQYHMIGCTIVGIKEGLTITGNVTEKYKRVRLKYNVQQL